MTKIISFYQDTEASNGYYEQSAKRLRAECKTIGQTVSILKRNFGEDYLSITRAKPVFILEQLKKTSDDLIWVDVDSTILKPFDFTYETLAFAAKPNGKPYGHIIYLPNNPETISFVEAWIETLKDWEGGDHSAMWLTLQQQQTPWEAIPNIGARVRFGISTHESAKQAQAHLENIGWSDTLKQISANLS